MLLFIVLSPSQLKPYCILLVFLFPYSIIILTHTIRNRQRTLSCTRTLSHRKLFTLSVYTFASNTCKPSVNRLRK